jgi:hypothetical protein
LDLTTCYESTGRVIRQFAACLVVALCFTVLSCSLFDPRSPENPEEAPYLWYDPYFPSTVLANMKSTFQVHHMAYMQCFDSTFVFLADPQDTIEYGGGGLEFGNWDFDIEYVVMDAMFGAAASAAGSFPEDSLASLMLNPMSEFPDEPAPADSTVVYREYEIVIAGSLVCGWDNPATGYARIYLIESEFGLWHVSSWEDYRLESSGDSLNTWGVAKANYR